MGNYAIPLVKRERNLIYPDDGSVWANYLIEGLNVNPYKDNITSYQQAHEILFNSLSRLPTDQFLLLGFKSQTSPDTIAQRLILPDDFHENKESYQSLIDQYQEFLNRVNSGEYSEHRRRFWLSIGIPNTKDQIERFMATLAITDPHAKVKSSEVDSFEQACFEAIPSMFYPERTNPGHIDYIFDRARLRGVEVPYWDDKKLSTPPAVTKPSEKLYPEIRLDKAADGTSLYSDFLDNLKKEKPSFLKKANKIFKGNFKDIVEGTVLGVHNMDEVSSDLPTGIVSYQAMLGISRYPSEPTLELNSFTYLVDQFIGLDADFALRFRFSQDIISQKRVTGLLRDLNSEDNSNSKDEISAGVYADRKDEVRDLWLTVKDASAPRGMEVAAVFSFAGPNLKEVQREIESIKTQFSSNGFRAFAPVGGQAHLWEFMMPGVGLSMMGDDLMHTTTTTLFGSFIPLRVSHAGDGKGIPLMINKENDLGQIIFHDPLHATDKGNASIAATGKQGVGKTNFMKVLLSYVSDLHRYAYVLDHSDNGEYVTFIRAVRGSSAQVVDVSGRNTRISLDPLKIFEPELAAQIFQDLWFPLLDLRPDDPEAVVLASLLRPDYRETVKGTVASTETTRKLIKALERDGRPEAEVLAVKLSYWANQTYTKAFIDPIEDGQVVEYAPFKPENNVVVFRTSGMDTFTKDDAKDFDKIPPSQKFTALAYTAVARIAVENFKVIRGACVFFGDEMSFLSDTPVLKDLVKKQDRMGRKEGNSVVTTSQLAQDFDENFALVRKNIAFGQDSEENAVPALRRVGMVPYDFLVERLRDDTSPTDPRNENFVMEGRLGEGYYNDGNTIVRVQVLPLLKEEQRVMGDTTSSRMIRESDLEEDE